MISFQASVSKAWLHQAGGFVFDERYYMDPLFRQGQDKIMNDFIRSQFPEYPLYNMEANLMQADHINDDQVLIGGIQPNLILARILGSEFVFYPDKDMDVSGHPLHDIISAEALPEMDQILAHPFIRNLEALIVHLQKTRPDLEVIPPFFWDNSGRATIHGIITTSFKLIGDKAMMMIIMDPDLLHSVHQWIVNAYRTLIVHFAGLADIPITSVHVGECSGTMISNDQYLETITPYVSQLGIDFGKVRLHSCGPSGHILQAISEIKNLNIIDTGSKTPIADIRKLLGPEFEINIEPPVELMLRNESVVELLSWLEIALDENKGGPLKFGLHLEPGYSFKNCLMIYDELKKRRMVG